MPYPDPANIAAAHSVIERIREACPHLHMHCGEPDRNIDLELSIPVQSGLSVPVTLNLQHDEMQMCVSEFHAHWFPCTDPAEMKQLVACVVGFLKGTVRLKETLRGHRVVRGELQRYTGMNWESFTVTGVLFPWLGRKSTRIIINECAR